MQLPESFKNNMMSLLGQEYENYEKSVDGDACSGIRVNRLKIQDSSDKAFFPETEGQVPWCSQGYYYLQQTQMAKHPYYHAGAYYIQEPSAMAPVAAMAVMPGDTVLDLCGAPGGKSTFIGEKLGGEGWLIANDISASRAQAMLKNIEQNGIRNAVVMSEEPSRIAARFQGFFDHVLVDAPCSGEGMFRKDGKLVKSWVERGSSYFVPIQSEILDAADKCIKPGGTLTYSTCTFNLEENEKQIRSFLERYPDYRLVAIPGKLGIDKGFDIPGSEGFDLSLTGRIWPHRHKGEGHFVAQLVKGGNAVESGSGWRTEYGNIDGHSYEALSSFSSEIGWQCPDKEQLYIIKDKILQHASKFPDTHGMRVMRTGLLLGTVKKGRFEPSQALAQAIDPGNVSRVIELDGNDYDTVRFLKGETIDADREKGYWLVAVDGMGIGFGKAVGGKLKNKRDANWRWK